LHVERHRLELIREAAQDVSPGGANAASGRPGRRALRARGRGALSGQAPPVELLLDGVASEEGGDRHVGHLGLLFESFQVDLARVYLKRFKTKRRMPKADRER
jgi:hypothetical protein